MFKKSQFPYKNEKTLEERKQEYQDMIKKYRQSVIVHIYKNLKSHLKGDLVEHKFIFNNDLKIFHIMQAIRFKLGLKQQDALYLFINNKELLKTDTSLFEAHDKYKDEDGFLYITFMEMNTFG